MTSTTSSTARVTRPSAVPTRGLRLRCTQRSAAPALDATAEHLPFDDDSVDAAMATVTVHQWSDVDRGLRELRRVSRGPVVVLTFDAPALRRFWLADYLPEVVEIGRAHV